MASADLADRPYMVDRQLQSLTPQRREVGTPVAPPQPKGCCACMACVTEAGTAAGWREPFVPRPFVPGMAMVVCDVDTPNNRSDDYPVELAGSARYPFRTS